MFNPKRSVPFPDLNKWGGGGRGMLKAPPIFSAPIRARGIKQICACPLFDNEFPTISELKSFFASFTLLFDNLCF